MHEATKLHRRQAKEGILQKTFEKIMNSNNPLDYEDDGEDAFAKLWNYLDIK